jgi:polyisoprenoid-binding protein YceI
MHTLASAFSAFTATALLATPAFAAPTAYEIDSAHSAATFSVKHMMVSTVRGEFGKLTGTVTLEGNDWKTAKVDATVDATTINTREPKRDAHLKSPDFFDVAKYPTLSFKSTKVEAGASGYKLSGDITIHGITKPIVFDVQTPSKEWKGLSGKQIVGTSATAKLNRKDFGLNWNRPLEAAGGMLVGDEVTITLDLELVKK